MKWIILTTTLASTSVIALSQMDWLSPAIQEQMPFLLVVCGIIIYLSRLYFQDQERQRLARIEERREERVAHEKAMQDQRESQVALLQIMMVANKETFNLAIQIQADSLEKTLEDGMDKIAGQYYRLEQQLGNEK